MKINATLDISTPATIEHLVDFIKTVIEGVEINIPPRSTLKIKKNSDCLGEDDNGISYGYRLENATLKYDIWFGIYFDFWKRKKSPVCIQIVSKDAPPKIILEKFEDFYAVHKKQLNTYAKNFDDYPTIGLNNKLLIESRTDDTVKLILELLKRLYFI